MIRKFFGKKTNFNLVSDKQIWIVNMLINLTHRKRLDGKSSYETSSIISLSNLKCCTWI
jgi:IS30 family transposase